MWFITKWRSRSTRLVFTRLVLWTACLELVGARPIVSQATDKGRGAPQIAFTFDDLPAHGPLPPGMPRTEVVRSILATLKREKLPPVYGFLNGFRVMQFPYQIQILRAWLRAGNPLGNHTWSHPELDKLPADTYERNIARNEPLLRKIDAGGDWHWFRYPFLEEGDTVAKREAVRAYLEAHHYQIAQVSMDFQDYLWNEPYARCMAQRDAAALLTLHDTYLRAASQFIGVFRTLTKNLYGRDVPYILLMHVGAFDARMLPELITLFREQGFQFVTLEQAMADPVYQFDPRAANPGGSTFNEQVAEVRKVDVPDGTEPEKLLDGLCR